MTPYATFGNRIKKLRLASGITQVQAVARQRKRRGVPLMNQSVLSRLEAGRLGPSAHALLVLCEIYQVSADYLLTGKEYHEQKSEQRSDGATGLLPDVQA